MASPESMDGQNSRVGKTGGYLDLAQKVPGACRPSQLGVEHLQRDPSVMLQVVRQVHDRAATPAQLALDRVAVGEGSTHSVQGVVQQPASG